MEGLENSEQKPARITPTREQIEAGFKYAEEHRDELGITNEKSNEVLNNARKESIFKAVEFLRANVKIKGDVSFLEATTENGEPVIKAHLPEKES